MDEREQILEQLRKMRVGSSWELVCKNEQLIKDKYANDMEMLVEVLNKLVDQGNSMIIIEHNLDVIKIADHIIDIGPEGGDKGGQVVAVGTPEEVAMCEKSYTGYYLKDILKG